MRSHRVLLGVSATVVAALVSDGIVSWDSKVADLDPAFRLAEPYPTSELTVRDLFSHRSGLPGTAGDDHHASRLCPVRRHRFPRRSSEADYIPRPRIARSLTPPGRACATRTFKAPSFGTRTCAGRT